MGWTESLEINLYIYGQQIFNKCAKTIQGRKDSLFNNGAGIKLIQTVECAYNGVQP
jgi:hypothetical protein